MNPAAPIRNPFKFGDPVDGDYYFPRPELTQTVRQFLDNRIHVVLIGPRRFGKTSFILDLIQRETKENKTCLLVDIFNVTSHRDFLQQIVRSLESKKPLVQRLKKWVESVPKLRPKFSWKNDPATGQTTFSIHPEFYSSEKDVKELIQDTLTALGKIGDNVVVALDEFQKISELEDQGWLEATLRTQMQQIRNAVFLFSGSRRSLIHDMFNNPGRPFYRACQIIDFPSLGDDFSDWVAKRFASVGIVCEREAIVELRRMVQDTPNYIQMACFHLVAQGVIRVDSSRVREVLRTVVKQNAYAYQTLLNSLTSLQQRALRLAAIEGQEIFSKDVLGKYEISSGPALASTIKSLKQKQILDDEGTRRGRVIFDDPLFAIWLRTEFSET